MTIAFWGSSFLTPLKSGLIRNSECLLSAYALSNIAAHSSKVLSILKLKTDIMEFDIIKILFVVVE